MPRRSKRPLPALNLGKETIGERITRLRKERGYTQRELGERIGIVHGLVSDYETGKLRLYDEMVSRFALALEVSTDEILGLKGNTSNGKKPSLKIVRRIGKLESLPPARQKTILKAIDLMIQSATKRD
jgi:transcriptional regulator with XRE-family HTH domain